MNISANVNKLMLLFVALFVGLSASMVYWQVGVASQVTANEHNGRQCLPENASRRGRILDRNGVVLAESTSTYSECSYLRHYTDASLAPLIGYYAGPLFSSLGIEHQFDDILSGRGSGATVQQDVNRVLHRVTEGNDIYLTIDERIQKIVEQRFKEPYFTGETSGGETSVASDKGAVIVTDPHTGEILAWLSQPSYDPNKLVAELGQNKLDYYNQLAQSTEHPLLDRVTRGLYVPGSIYKTVTLMAALDSGHTNIDSTFDKEHALGPVYYDGHPIGPIGNNIESYTSRYPVNTEYAFSHSDNVIFAQLGVNTSLNTWLEYNKKLYVGEQIPFDLPIEVSSVLPAGKDTMSDVELATDAFGQGTDLVTPIQMSLVANTAANNGQLMRPTIIKKITSHDKQDLQTSTPQTLGNPISSDTATKVRQAMYGVVACGPGTLSSSFVADTQWGMIGKTGTGEVSTNNEVPPHAWFISAAPYQLSNPSQLPALTIVSMHENGGDGGAANAPLSEHIYDDIFSQNLVKVTKPTNTFWTNYCSQTQLLQG
jgi:peptidoglycan glycosyltransferase